MKVGNFMNIENVSISFENMQKYIDELMKMFDIQYIDYDININGNNICMLFSSQYINTQYRIFINNDLYIIIQNIDIENGDCIDVISLKVDTSDCINLNIYFYKVAYTITAMIQYIDK